MNEPIPITPMFRYYVSPSVQGSRQTRARAPINCASTRLRVSSGTQPSWSTSSEESLAQAEDYFGRHDFGAQDFYPDRVSSRSRSASKAPTRSVAGSITGGRLRGAYSATIR